MGVLVFGIGGALTIASLVRSVLPNSAVVENLGARIKSWWWIASILVTALLAGPLAVTALFAVVSFLAFREFSTVAAYRPTDRRVIAVCAFVLLPAQYALAAFGKVAFGGAVLILLLTALAGDAQNYLARVTERLFGMAACVFGLSFIPAIFRLPLSSDKRQVLLFLVLITQASDIFQYVWGKTIGRHHFAPHISPGKTLEGLVGGIASATALGAAVSSMTPFKPAQAALISFLISLAGFCGGFIMSAIKRDRGIKDWSNLIPGHGGMLDRVDSLWLSAPLYFWALRELV